MTKVFTFTVVLAVFLSLLPSANAVVVVDYNLTGNAGNEVSEAPNSAATNITGLSMTRGAGLGVATAANSFSSNGWDSTALGALSNEFISFGFTVASGFYANLDGLNIGTRSSNTGPGAIGLYYSGDNFAAPLTTFAQPGETVVNSAVNLLSLPNLTGTVEFRLIEIGNTQADGVGATANTGTFRVADYFIGGVESTNVQFTGTIAAVPEASAFLFGGVIAGVFGLGYAGRRVFAARARPRRQLLGQ